MKSFKNEQIRFELLLRYTETNKKQIKISLREDGTLYSIRTSINMRTGKTQLFTLPEMPFFAMSQIREKEKQQSKYLHINAI